MSIRESSLITLIFILFIYHSLEQIPSCSYFDIGLKSYCEILQFNSTHGCQYINGSCIIKPSCSSYKGTDENACKSIKLLNYSKKCIFDDNNNCIEVTKSCEEYEKGKNLCSELNAGNNKRCLLYNGICSAHYDFCQAFISDVDEIKCKSNIPLNPLTKCNWDNGRCVDTFRDCKEFEYELCSSLEISLPLKTSSIYQICLPSYNGFGCKEQFFNCELYDKMTEPSKKTQIDCETIIVIDINHKSPDPFSKCVFKDGACITSKKECAEITNSLYCIYNTLNDENKRCVYEDESCKEVFKSCSSYNSVQNKNEKDCKSIKIYNIQGNIDYNYRCIFQNNECIQKKLEKCEDYESDLDIQYCSSIILNTNEKCAIKDGKCVKHFSLCPKESTEEECKSKSLDSETYKCVYDSKEGCIQKPKECSEYQGNDYDICENELISSDENKKCFMENGKCIAKYIFCTSYEGNDKAICESIIPFKDKETSLKYSHKCVFDNNKCVMKEKECKEAKSFEECKLIQPAINKKCIYQNNECKEQYKDCESYNNNGKDTIEKTVCESIILDNPLEVCTFKPGSPNKCEKKIKVCSDFNKDDFSDMCYSLQLSSVGKKCIYSNSACAEINKSCLELYYESSVTEEICSAAPTTDPNTKICSVKIDGFGCEEIEKEEQDNANKSNFGIDNNKLIFNLLLIILGLLL